MEHVKGGEMLKRIRRKKTFPESMARHIMTQLTNAVKFMHRLGVVHRDLKPEVSSTGTTHSVTPCLLHLVCEHAALQRRIARHKLLSSTKKQLHAEGERESFVSNSEYMLYVNE